MAMRDRYKISDERTVYQDHLTIQEARISNPESEYTRSRVKRQPGAAVLVYNSDEDALVLTRQFRYPVHDETREDFLEIMAGIVDGDESPEQTASREAEEEIGYRIPAKALRKISACFITPGYSSEMLYHFYATVTNADKVKKGGGVAGEHEHIDVVYMKRSEFEEKVRKAAFIDGKTLHAGYWFLLNISPGLP